MGGEPIQCFMLEPTDEQEVSLRRFATKSIVPCTVAGRTYHNAHAAIERGPFDDDAASADDHPHDDPRWPRTCACGYLFEPDDMWQRMVLRLYRRTDTGDLMDLRSPPLGAMWFAPWYEDTWKGPDGHCLVVVTPAGEWVVDSPSSDGSGWNRTGVPPNVTATPSIGQQDLDTGGWKYHGWLRDGKLVEC